MKTQTIELSDSQLISLLIKFTNQKPGLDPREYGASYQEYRREARRITKDRHDALVLVSAVAERPAAIGKLRHYLETSGDRLTLSADKLEYCVGQYFPTEYRPAVARACASALWAYWRDDVHGGTLEAGDIRDSARRTFRSKRIREYFGI
jgi:hypothetical protein